MADSSFDVVSKVDRMELDNALNQASREVATRFDFKNTGVKIEMSGEKILVEAETEERVKAALDVFKEKLIKRGVSLKHLDIADPAQSGKVYRIFCTVKEGKNYCVVLLQKIDSFKKEMLKVLSPVIKVIKKLETKN